MEFSDNFIPSMKEAFGGVNYIAVSPHFLQRWEERKKSLGEDAICAIIADWIANNPLDSLDERFTIRSKKMKTTIGCVQRPFRLPENQVGRLINLLTIY
jgi:hypothetical protein